LPNFDPTRKPLLSKVFSAPMADLITKCLSLTPANRPSWSDFNMKELSKVVVVEEVEEIPIEHEEIHLGTKK